MRKRQPSVGNQDSPKGDKECSKCSHIPGGECRTLVDGETSSKVGASSRSKRPAGRLGKDILLGGLMTEAARYPRGNRAACSLGLQSRSPTSARILRLCQSRALIHINGRSAVAEKHQSTAKLHRCLSDMALAAAGCISPAGLFRAIVAGSAVISDYSWANGFCTKSGPISSTGLSS
jgi:hypothetical protein